MPDIKQLNVDNTVYNLKDEVARQQLANTYTKEQINNLIVPANTEIVVVEELPQEDGAANTIYRVQGEDSYTDYGWDGTQFVKLAEYNGTNLYGDTGQNTDGAMTQKAVTDSLSTKLDESDIADENDVEELFSLAITFADSNVEAALVAKGIGGGLIEGKITEPEAALVTSLSDALKGKDITSFNELRYFTGLTTLKSAFAGCSKLQSVTLPTISTVTELQKAFFGCLSLQELDLSPLAGSEITNAANMVDSAVNLTTLNLTGIDFSSQTSDMMFNYVPALTTISGVEGLTSNINLESSPRLSHESAVAILDSIGSVEENSGKTIKFSCTTYATLTASDKAIATEKNWTVSEIDPLPEGFTLLKGIRNPSTAYIDTGVIPSLQVNILADMAWESGVWLYGDTKYATGVSVQLQRLSPGWRLKLGGSSTTHTANTPVAVAGERHVFQQGYDASYPNPALKIPFIIDGIEKWVKTNAATTENLRNHTLLIFASHGTGETSGPENPVVGTNYGFMIYDVNGNEIRNFIPVLSNNNVAGLWEQDGGLFYPSNDVEQFEAITF